MLAWAGTDLGWAQEKPDAGQTAPAASAPAPVPAAKPGGAKQGAATGAALEQQDLQKAIEQASNDRAALMHNLLEHLKKYPQSSQRPQIYRAIVESSSSIVHRPRPTGWRGLMFVLFQWVRSRTAAIVGLVVPISFEICASDSSGWLRTR